MRHQQSSREDDSRHRNHRTESAGERPPRADGGGIRLERRPDQPRRRRSDTERSAAARPQPRRATLETLRQSPIRSSLVGLAVIAGAAPLAVSRYQQALRMDPGHERLLALGGVRGGDTDGAVAGVWQDLEAQDGQAIEDREAVIAKSLNQYSDYDLTRELAEEIYDSAQEQGIDPAVAFGLVRAESSFKNTSTSGVGAVGLTQLMPRTAEWLEPGVTQSQLRDPGTNLRIGFRYLRSLIDQYDGDTSLALTAYNRGPGTVAREIRNGRDPDNGYADFVYGREGHGHTLYTN